jgi:hypothetical protein
MPEECKHPNARLVGVKSLDFVNAYCADCDLGWIGPSYDWTSRQGAVHRVPAWVRRLIKAAGQPKTRPE